LNDLFYGAQRAHDNFQVDLFASQPTDSKKAVADLFEQDIARKGYGLERTGNVFQINYKGREFIFDPSSKRLLDSSVNNAAMASQVLRTSSGRTLEDIEVMHKEKSPREEWEKDNEVLKYVQIIENLPNEQLGKLHKEALGRISNSADRKSLNDYLDDLEWHIDVWRELQRPMAVWKKALHLVIFKRWSKNSIGELWERNQDIQRQKEKLKHLDLSDKFLNDIVYGLQRSKDNVIADKIIEQIPDMPVRSQAQYLLEELKAKGYKVSSHHETLKVVLGEEVYSINPSKDLPIVIGLEVIDLLKNTAYPLTDNSIFLHSVNAHSDHLKWMIMSKKLTLKKDPNIFIVGGSIYEVRMLKDLFPEAKITVVSLDDIALKNIQEKYFESTEWLKLYKADASHLKKELFPDQGFDFFYMQGIEFSAFSGMRSSQSEAIIDQIIQQAVRLVKPGGYIFDGSAAINKHMWRARVSQGALLSVNDELMNLFKVPDAAMTSPESPLHPEAKMLKEWQSIFDTLSLQDFSPDDYVELGPVKHIVFFHSRPFELGGIKTYQQEVMQSLLSTNQGLNLEYVYFNDMDHVTEHTMVDLRRNNRLHFRGVPVKKDGMKLTVEERTGLIRQRISAIQAEKPVDLVFLNSSTPDFNYLTGLVGLAKEHNMAVQYYFHGGAITKAVEYLVKNADVAVTNSRFYQNVFGSLGMDKVGLLYPVTYTWDAAPYDQQLIENLKIQYGLANRKIILQAGRITAKKGQEMTVRAAGEFVKKHPELASQVSFVIVGPEWSKENRERYHLRQLARELGVDITFVEGKYMEQLRYWYDASYAVLYPTLSDEPFGLVSVEAQARGIPVIVSNGGGLPETVQDGVTGFVVRRGNFSDMADRFFDLVSDQSRREAMSHAAREHIRSTFSFRENMHAVTESFKRAWQQKKREEASQPTAKIPTDDKDAQVVLSNVYNERAPLTNSKGQTFASRLQADNIYLPSDTELLRQWKRGWYERLFQSIPTWDPKHTFLPFYDAPDTIMAYDPLLIPVRSFGDYQWLIFPTGLRGSSATLLRRDPATKRNNPFYAATEPRKRIMDDPFNPNYQVTVNTYPKVEFDSLIYSKKWQEQVLTRDGIDLQLRWAREGAVTEFHRTKAFLPHFHMHLYAFETASIARYASTFKPDVSEGSVQLGQTAYSLPHLALRSSNDKELAEAVMRIVDRLEVGEYLFVDTVMLEPGTSNVIVIFTMFREDAKQTSFSPVGFLKTGALVDEDMLVGFEEQFFTYAELKGIIIPVLPKPVRHPVIFYGQSGAGKTTFRQMLMSDQTQNRLSFVRVVTTQRQQELKAPEDYVSISPEQFTAEEKAGKIILVHENVGGIKYGHFADDLAVKEKGVTPIIETSDISDVKAIKELYPDAQVILFSVSDSDEDVGQFNPTIIRSLFIENFKGDPKWRREYEKLKQAIEYEAAKNTGNAPDSAMITRETRNRLDVIDEIWESSQTSSAMIANNINQELVPDEKNKALIEKAVSRMPLVDSKNLVYKSFDEFYQQLKVLIAGLNRKLDEVEGEYAILLDHHPHQSKRWVYELSKDLLSKKPSKLIYAQNNRAEDLKKFKTVVILDDVSQTGLSLTNSLYFLIKMGFKGKVILAHVYESQVAILKVEDWIAKHGLNEDVQVEFIHVPGQRFDQENIYFAHKLPMGSLTNLFQYVGNDKEWPVKNSEIYRQEGTEYYARESREYEAAKNTGGIDLQNVEPEIQSPSGKGMKFAIDPAMLKELENAPGFVPVIITIEPMNNVREFLGLAV
jgi:glycosyltransferase involved in cell wall biosynthesis